MSLLQQIQEECTAKESDIPRLLRLCLQLAGRLKHQALREWVLAELNGYPSADAVPKYRRFAVRSIGDFKNRATGDSMTLQISLNVLPEELRQKYGVLSLDQPISQYQALVDEARASSELDRTIQSPWKIDDAVIHGTKMTKNMQCINAWREVPLASLVGMLDTVKTRVLSMVLDLESENPNAGDVPPGRPLIPEAKVTQIITTNIYGGNVQNLSAGSTGVTQAAGDQVLAGDVESLTRALAAAGVTAEETQELRAALAADGAQPGEGLGKRAAAWIKRLAVAAATTGREVAVAVVSQMITAYIGPASAKP